METDLAKKRLLNGAEEAEKYIREIGKTNHYIQSYPHLVKASKLLCEQLKENAIPAIAHLAYGWMPRILQKYNFGEETATTDAIFNASKMDSTSNVSEWFEDIKATPINNSWVGLSKVLHFINPEIFPIWDGNVAKHFGVTTKKKENYAKYICFCESMKDCPAVKRFQDVFYEEIDYEISKIRAVELILFTVKSEEGA